MLDFIVFIMLHKKIAKQTTYFHFYKTLLNLQIKNLDALAFFSVVDNHDWPDDYVTPADIYLLIHVVLREKRVKDKSEPRILKI